MAYDGLLALGIAMLTGLAYALATDQRHALKGQVGLQVTLFCSFAMYFVLSWRVYGQTLGMRTWRIKLVTRDIGPLGLALAVGRYALAWLWVLPGMMATHILDIRNLWQAAGIIAANVALVALLTRVDSASQFLHDKICDTVLIDLRTKDLLQHASPDSNEA